MKPLDTLVKDFVPDPSIEIPYTTFRGWLKCHRPELSNELQMAGMQAAFPKFLTRESMSDEEMKRYKKMAEQKTYHSIFWTGRPSRRYAGDYLDQFTLPRGCYYTVCQNEWGEDRQTLANEMMAYRDPEKSGECYAYDLSEKKPDEGRSRAIHVIFRSQPHLYNPIFRILSKQEWFAERFINAELALQAFLPFARESFKIEITYQVEFKTIERVVDLRFPAVRAWFAKTFAEGDGRVFSKHLISQRPEDITFREMLPTLMFPTRGGNNVTTAIGLWMRLYGVNALIFPSARSNVRITIHHGQLVDKGFWGWNLVDYRGAPASPVTFQRSIEFADWEQVGPMDSIGHAPSGDEYEGSLLIDGVVERREKNFKENVERFYDRRFMIHPEGLDIGPVDLAFIQSKLEAGAIATTTGVTSQDDHLPIFRPGTVGDLFAFPSPKLKSEASFSRPAKPQWADVPKQRGDWKPSGNWFQERNIGGLEFEIKCPVCSWEGSYFAKDEVPPCECPHCRHPKENSDKD
jgi:hypothetical protein